jgi:pimeloyl-ACP methyl ester carboxylesterase
MRNGQSIPANKRQSWRICLIGLVFAVIALLAANTIWVDSRTRPASPRDGGMIIDTGIEPANVRVEGQGPPILLLHGFGAAIDWWDEVAPALAAHYRLIRVDLIGHGGTAAPAVGYTIERQAQLAAAVLDKLGVGHVTVIGHSMGGEVAVALAESNRERIDRMILIDSPPTADTTFSIMTKIYLMPVVGEMFSHFQSDQAIRRGLAQGFAPNFLIAAKRLPMNDSPLSRPVHVC